MPPARTIYLVRVVGVAGGLGTRLGGLAVSVATTGGIWDIASGVGNA